MALNENYKKPPEQVRYDMEQRAAGASIVDGAIHGDD
jgi:hypothetical protein